MDTAAHQQPAAYAVQPHHQQQQDQPTAIHIEPDQDQDPPPTLIHQSDSDQSVKPSSPAPVVTDAAETTHPTV